MINIIDAHTFLGAMMHAYSGIWKVRKNHKAILSHLGSLSFKNTIQNKTNHHGRGDGSAGQTAGHRNLMCRVGTLNPH